jgi:hypothetical protein
MLIEGFETKNLNGILTYENTKIGELEAARKRRGRGKLKKSRPQLGGPETHGRQGGRQQVSARGSAIEQAHTM